MRLVARGDASGLFTPADAPSAACSSSDGGLRALLARTPFASIGAGLPGPAAAAASSATVTERRTKTVFPGELEYCAGRKGCPVVAGVGARTKRIAGIKSLDIYAVSLYVDPAAARSALGGRFGGAASADALARDQALFDELVASDQVPKTLRIVITSGLVKRKAFLEALEERLEPPLKQAGEAGALEAFTRQFDAAHFRKGLQITFTAAGSKLRTAIDGQEVGAIANATLARSLLDIYLGANPVSPGAKADMGRGLAAMVLA